MTELQNTIYWFNLKSLKVEKGLKSAAPYRVGPFSTQAEAANAIKLLADRSKEWATEEDSQN
jgi:hypothetical protein